MRSSIESTTCSMNEVNSHDDIMLKLLKPMLQVWLTDYVIHWTVSGGLFSLKFSEFTFDIDGWYCLSKLNCHNAK